MTAPRDDYHVLTVIHKGDTKEVHESTPQGARERARAEYPRHTEVSMQSQREYLREMGL